MQYSYSPRQEKAKTLATPAQRKALEEFSKRCASEKTRRPAIECRR